MSLPFRLITNPPAEGAWNMAVDEAILESAATGSSPPTLRLYAWSPPCLSIGYAQSVSDVDQAALDRLGWGLVRRPTGGRAILHTDELTYSIVAPLKHPLVAGRVLESYQRIAQGLLAALERLNLPARADEAYPSQVGVNRQAPVCFVVPSNFEVTVDGKKLIGSAQARRRNGVLQHGSLPLAGDLIRILQVLRIPEASSREKEATRLLDHAATAEQALGRPVSWQEAADAFIAAFAQTFDLSFDRQDLQPGERQRAEELARTRYAHPSWTCRS